METLSFDLIDERTGLNVNVTVTDEGDGTLTFDLEVHSESGSIGDLNGLFFDLANDNLVGALKVEGDDVTGQSLATDSVTKVDGYNNINGEIKNEYGSFDAGIQFGTQGIAEDDIRFTTFTLSYENDGHSLTLDDILGQDFAVRLTSVGEENGDRNDSLKIGGTAEGEVIEETPSDDTSGTDDGAPTGETGGTDDGTPTGDQSVNVATDNSLFVSNKETFGAPDELDDDLLTILDDDTTDEFMYEGVVVAANGIELSSTDPSNSIVVDGSNGGQLMITEDGQLDFSANGDFNNLDEGQTVDTLFTYQIEGGSTATITVQVFGDTDENLNDEGSLDEEYFEGEYYEEPLSDFG